MRNYLRRMKTVAIPEASYESSPDKNALRDL
jgi:hypothetical protein